jgi:L-methionine (R)-S-oxide reductase
MTESLTISHTDRPGIYKELIPQVRILTESEPDMIANMANLAAVLKEAFGFFWIGFYIIREDELVLGPFQGPLACTRIAKGRGVCGTAWAEDKAIIVPDVDAFPGHIACSSLSKSEIVLPVRDAQGNIFAILDVDSDKLNDFSEVDHMGLAHLMESVKWQTQMETSEVVNLTTDPEAL